MSEEQTYQLRCAAILRHRPWLTYTPPLTEEWKFRQKYGLPKWRPERTLQ